jgi:hypothetical protein
MTGRAKARVVQYTVGLAVVLAFAVPQVAQAAPKSNELAPKHVAKSLLRADDNAPGQVRGDAGKPSKPQSNGINYHGGPVQLGTTSVYLIWYGNWSANTATSIIPSFVTSDSGSPYFNINTTYYNGAGTKVSNSLSLAGQASDAYSQGSSLSDNGVQAVVQRAISTGSLPANSAAVYFVLTSGDVAETSGFLTQYCGWHTSATIGGQDIKFAFVGNPSKNLAACAAQTSKSPNGNVAADAMVSIVAHELEESVTDPDLNAWYDSRGYENADKCAWTFGTTYKTANGSVANMKLAGKDYLVQRNWVNASGGFCSTQY